MQGLQFGRRSSSLTKNRDQEFKFACLSYHDYDRIKVNQMKLEVKTFRRILNLSMPFLDERRMEDLIKYAEIKHFDLNEVVLKEKQTVKDFIFLVKGEMIIESPLDVTTESFYPWNIHRNAK